tara:strand:- start:95829 stop:96872 length:1044 start_codon:yes stop_codon:yes gene_type:complete
MGKILSFAVLLMLPFVVNAQMKAENWQVEGEVDVLTRLGSQPTSERGQVAFSLPSLKLAADYLIEKNNSVYFQVQMAENRNKDTKKFQTELARAYFQHISESDSWIVRYGLIKNAYLDDNELLLDYDVVPEFRAFAYRYNYLPSADIGLEIRYVTSPYLDFSVGVYNGEENTTKEDGMQKDTYIGINYDDSSFHFAALAIRGAYDEYESPFNVKERNLVRIAWKGNLVELGLEGLTSKELSNATVAYGRAEGWDGSAYPETMVQAEGASAWLLFKVDSELQFLARKDYLDPYKDVKLDEIESENIAMIVKDNMRSCILGYTKTVYKDLHSTKSNEKEFGFFGLRQIF